MCVLSKALNNFVNINKNTFCAAPWFQIRNDNLGCYKACCQIDTSKTEFDGNTELKWPTHSFDQWLNSDYAVYLRENLTQGKQLSECNRCWFAEDHGQLSLRQIINNTLTGNQGSNLDQTWMKSYFKNKTDFKQDLLISADVKLTNLCNFACAMCSPENSTQIYVKWYNDKQHPIVQAHLENRPNYFSEIKSVFVDKNNHELLEQILDKKPKYIKLLGGEPLLDTVALDMLAALPDAYKKQTELQFITNGSVSLEQTRIKLGNFKKIFFTVSLEGIGAVQDWVRRGSNWSAIERNLLDYTAQHSKHGVSIHHTVQCLTVYHLSNLLRWADQNKIPVTVGMLDYPRYLGLDAMPKDLLLATVDRLNNMPDLTLNSCNDAEVVESISNKKLAQMVLASAPNELFTSRLKNFVDWYDPTQHWKTVVPEWLPYF